MAESTSGPDLFNRLADEFAERYRQGERPPLAEYTGKYPDLADQIRELFPAMLAMEQLGPVDEPATGPFAPGPGGEGPIPERLGDFRIIREIARGGMGIVYEAVQESLDRHVALKVLPHHRMVSPNQLERFQREARAAAMLHHSNIVPVFGVGKHEGVHYYAMQYIQGQGLDAVLREVKRLRGTSGAIPSPSSSSAPDPALAASVAQELVSGTFGGENRPPAEAPTRTEADTTATGCEARTGAPSTARASSPSTTSIVGQSGAPYYRGVARIGIQAAEALAYAHQQKLLHRDIKPANLLLDLQGAAWVTDFGLAKAEGTDELTSPGDIVGTLRYMAPERFRGRADARSDIYALGLTLHEMLTLEPAFAADGRAELIDRILHAEPPRPRERDPHVPRDLETIVLKAIAKEPRDRYQSATELAEDLRRFLGDRPVLARRIGPAEHAWRWARRNPAAAALVVVFLVGLPLVTALWLLSERRRGEAERSLAQARAAVDDYLTTVSESTLLNSPVPGMQPLRRQLLEAALRYYQEFVRQHRHDPSLQSELAASYARVGEINAQVGSAAQATQPLLEAIRLYRRLSAANPSVSTFRAELGHCLTRLGKVEFDSGRPGDAIHHFGEGIRMLEQFVGDHPEAVRARMDLAFGHHYLGTMYVYSGDTTSGEPALIRAIELRRALADEHPRDLSYAIALLGSLTNFSDLLRVSGRLTQALETIRDVNALQRVLARTHPEDAEIRQWLSRSCYGMGAMLLSLGRSEEAESSFRESVAIVEKVVAENPAVTAYRIWLASALSRLGEVQVDRGQLNEGIKSLQRGQEVAEDLEATVPGNLTNLSTLETIDRGLGKGLAKRGDPIAGFLSLQKAIAIGQRIASERSIHAYNYACALALCAELAGRLEPKDGGGRDVVRRYADRSMEVLRQAVAAGWKDVEGIERDPDLESIRDRQDFHELVRSLRASRPSTARP